MIIISRFGLMLYVEANPRRMAKLQDSSARRLVGHEALKNHFYALESNEVHK